MQTKKEKVGFNKVRSRKTIKQMKNLLNKRMSSVQHNNIKNKQKIYMKDNKRTPQKAVKKKLPKKVTDEIRSEIVGDTYTDKEMREADASVTEFCFVATKTPQSMLNIDVNELHPMNTDEVTTYHFVRTPGEVKLLDKELALN